MSEKEATNTSLLPLSTTAPPPSKRSRIGKFVVAISLAICFFKLIHFIALYGFEATKYCSQADVLTPKKHKELWDNLTEVIGTPTFESRAIDWLAGAVKVPTESYDDFAPVGEDPRWEKFSKFHDYLLTAFPQTHANMELTKVNTYGLVYVWQGQNSSLKPILLMAHQDVVPVEPSTWKSWQHPPFSGHFDGERIWGRGSSDDKSGLVAIMSAVELLIENGFRPTRTIVLAFGFDEEISGTQGACFISVALEARFGKDGIALIVDEGAGFAEQYGSVFATLGIAEKGYYDVKVEIATAGGHSSVPPPHTSIGILSLLLVHYERHPFETRLLRDDPLYATILCYAEHAQSLPARLRYLIKLSTYSNSALLLLEKLVLKNRLWKSLAGTTQAIDVIHGGVKSNALPEKVYAVINHRIAVHSSVMATQGRDSRHAEAIAARYNLTLDSFGTSTNESAPSIGTLTLSDAYIPGLEPAPMTATDAVPYQLLSGTVKATYNSHRALQGSEQIHVAPGMMTGNTDSRYYWDLSKHIFRYNHHNGGNSTNAVASGIHTVNESIFVDAFLEMIRFFATLVLNSDEATAL